MVFRSIRQGMPVSYLLGQCPRLTDVQGARAGTVQKQSSPPDKVDYFLRAIGRVPDLIIRNIKESISTPTKGALQ